MNLPLSLRHPRLMSSGLSLIELMIALVLGLFVVGGAIGLFLTNQRTYRATEGLGRVQESARVAFELMARDLREAGANPCNTSLVPVNIVSSSDPFLSNWSDGIIGISGTDDFSDPVQSGRISGSDAIEVKAASATGAFVTSQMTSKAADIAVSNTAGVVDGGVVMVCDFELATIFRVTGVGAGAISHGAGSNCSDGFYKNLCASPPASSGAWHRYRNDAMIAVPRAQRWYVAANDRDGASLFRTVVHVGSGGLPVSDTQEIAEGVSSMQLTYLTEGGDSYVPSTGVTAWGNVIAVRVALSLTGERIDGDNITRNLIHVVALRNHIL